MGVLTKRLHEIEALKNSLKKTQTPLWTSNQNTKHEIISQKNCQKPSERWRERIEGSFRTINALILVKWENTRFTVWFESEMESTNKGRKFPEFCWVNRRGLKNKVAAFLIDSSSYSVKRRNGGLISRLDGPESEKSSVGKVQGNAVWRDYIFMGRASADQIIRILLPCLHKGNAQDGNCGIYCLIGSSHYQSSWLFNHFCIFPLSNITSNSCLLYTSPSPRD